MAGASRGNPFESDSATQSGSGLKLKRDKRAVALYLKEETTRRGNPKPLHDYLDTVCDPDTPIDDPDTIDWYKWLIAGGLTYEEFGRRVREYDSSVMCGLVWTANFVAYRCRTCGISPCMSICSDCFQAGDHEGHDYNMFKSQAGGACDCGDTSVMRPEGFCPRHGHAHGRKPPSSPPADLMAVPREMVARVFHRLVLYLREHAASDVRLQRLFYQSNISDLDTYLAFLQSLSDMGAAMRRVMTETLTNQDNYNKTIGSALSDGDMKNYVIFLDQLKKKSHLPANFHKYSGKPEYPGLSGTPEYSTVLEELLYWVVHFEFPQRLVTFLLGLLPDDLYKVAFSTAFVKHYHRISAVLTQARERSTVANRIVHISVQLFSNQSLAVQLAEEYSLLLVIILSLANMVQDIRVASVLEDVELRSNFHAVVNCEHEMMKEHCYWPVVSDLINVLSHRDIALRFLKDGNLVDLWLELLTDMQGMNVNQRETQTHVEFEPDTYYAAFSAELEMSASPMWSLLMHCQTPDTRDLVTKVVTATTSALAEWLEAINFTETMKPLASQLTFHLPLHRYLAMFVMTAVNVHGLPLTSVLPDASLLKCLMMHPLQIQSCLSQIYAGMWLRNGIQIKGQAMTYIQCHFCYSMSDADLYLLQLCATRLNPDLFVETVLERYQITDWLSYSARRLPGSPRLDAEHELAMVEGCLSLLCSVLGIHTYLGLSQEALMRQEMASLLCMSDRPHSSLLDLMPEKTGVSGWPRDLFTPTLNSLADYRPPDFQSSSGLQQGTYVPKASVWGSDFDPVHVSQRAIYRRDMQSAMDRYGAWARSSKGYKKKSAPWPPFLTREPVKEEYRGIYRILSSKVMHAFLFSVVHKCASVSPSLPENIACLAVHLLDLCLHHSQPDPDCQIGSTNLTVPDTELSHWFKSSDIRVNACAVVGEVTVSVSQEPPRGSTNEDSLEDLFQLSPSAILSTGGPLTSAHTGPVTSAQLGYMPTPVMVPIPSISGSPGLAGGQGHGKSRSRGMTTGQLTTKRVPVGESLVSALLKLHAKLGAAGQGYKPGNQVTAHPGVGDGAHYVARLLDKFYAADQRVAQTVDEACSSMKVSRSAGGAVSTEHKRRKAWNRQQKLMTEFANKQKTFLQQAMETGDLTATGDPTHAGSSDVPPTAPLAAEYDCVICGQSTASTDQRLVGVVAFLQASSVLGHRHQTDQEKTLTLSESAVRRFEKGTCGKTYKRKFEAMQASFEEKWCEMSVNIGWEGGVVVRTCGHYLHLDCHQSYLSSLQSQSQSEVLAASKREYWCPLCRQLSNAVIPIVPDEYLVATVMAKSGNSAEIVAEINKMVGKPSENLRKGNPELSSAMSTLLEDLTNITYPAYRTLATAPDTQSVLLFLTSLIRTNLELELLQRGGNLLSPPGPNAVKKHCIVPMFRVLSQHCGLLVSDSTLTDLLQGLTGLPLDPRSEGTDKERGPQEERRGPQEEREVPHLLKDPLSLLIEFVLTLANNLTQERLDCVIQILYNLTFTQALVYLSLKLSTEERDAWRRKGRQTEADSLAGSLSHVIGWLSRSCLYEEEVTKLPAICQSVWSPQSLAQTVQEFCLPFLRVCCLLKQHLFHITPPHHEGRSEFQFLSTFLRLGQTERGGASASVGGGANEGGGAVSCVGWLVEEPHTVVRGWCSRLSDYINSHSQQAKILLQINPNWQGPSLVALPKRYYQIFQMFRTAKCVQCKQAPKEPAICLICGTLVCFRENCCADNSVFESVAHSVTCGAGTGIFLLVNSSVVIVIRGARATPWGSVYLDEHGEEDRDLKRGKPLFLSQPRYEVLQRQWISHSFDHTCKRWIWHRDQL